MVGRVIPSCHPQDVCVLILRTCEYARLHAKGNKVAERIKIANQLTLNREIVLYYLGNPNNITIFFKMEKKQGRREDQSDMMSEGLDLILLILKMSNKATSQSINVAIRT